MKDPSANLPSSPKAVQTYVFGGILILLLIAVCMVFAPFFTVLLWSGIFYVIFFPLYSRITGKLDLSSPRGRILRNLAAGVFALGTLIIIAGPLFFTALQFIKQVIELFRAGQDVLNSRPGMLQEILENISRFLNDMSSGFINISAENIRQGMAEFFRTSLQGMVQFSSSLAKNVGGFVAGIFLLVFCLFFMFTDGPYIYRLISRAIPIRKDYFGTLSKKITEITRNLFFGYIMVALMQGVMAYIIFLIFQVKGALVFAGLTFFSVFIPIFGGGLVWLPLGIVRILGGDTVGGVIFIIVSAIFISTLDNFIRPFFLQNRIKLHPLIIFFAILGGINV
ncbi:MAG: AI-2E family transporter, partial [Treponema sp.]|nr:AI-2E family transporter [Treponema sp.]